MSDGPFDDLQDGAAVEPEASPAPRPPRDPSSTLATAMVAYIFVTLVFALPLVILPETFFDIIGLDDRVARDLGGLRWVGAMLLAWAVTGILVMAKPEGRSVFVTAGALQLTLGAAAFVYSWSISEYEWSTWYHVLAAAILAACAGFLWWARLRARHVFKPPEA